MLLEAGIKCKFFEAKQGDMWGKKGDWVGNLCPDSWFQCFLKPNSGELVANLRKGVCAVWHNLQPSMLMAECLQLVWQIPEEDEEFRWTPDWNIEIPVLSIEIQVLFFDFDLQDGRGTFRVKPVYRTSTRILQGIS